MLKFEKETLEQLTFVFETGGNNAHVTKVITGIESFVYGAILFGQLKLTKKGIVRVFGHDESYRGCIKLNENGLPIKNKQMN